MTVMELVVEAVTKAVNTCPIFDIEFSFYTLVVIVMLDS